MGTSGSQVGLLAFHFLECVSPPHSRVGGIVSCSLSTPFFHPKYRMLYLTIFFCNEIKRYGRASEMLGLS